MRAPRSALAALSLSALLGCSSPVVNVTATIVTSACPLATAVDPQRDPTLGVDTLRFTLTGDGLSSVTINAPYANNRASIPNVPLGTNRRLVVEALTSGTELVRSRADSGLFDVTADGDVQVALFLRVVDAFVFTGNQDSSACTNLITPRAGHQMSLLPDGRVLITGGYNIDAQSELHYLAQAEVYDPRSGTFANIGTPANYGRAGHASAPVVVNGLPQILLYGGEGLIGGAIGPVGPFELFSNGAFTSIPLPSGDSHRERASTAVDVKTGYAVMAGGANGPDVPGQSVTISDQVDYFNPQQDAIALVEEPLAQPIADAVAVSRQNKATGGVVQGGVVLLGGEDSTGSASAQISGIIFSQTTHTYTLDHTYEASPVSALPAPRTHHAAVVAPDDTIFVIGGLNTASASYQTATAAITVVDPSSLTVEDADGSLSQERADGCATVLNSGQILYAGGAWSDANGIHSVGSADLISPAGAASAVRTLEGPTSGGNWNLQAARHKAACIVLPDGTLLVTGGLQFQSSTGTPIALGSAEIYTPPSQ